MWELDRDSAQPLYLQIVDYIEQSISYGEFPPGSSLPSERKLAEQLGVNRSTVVLAYDELRSYGIIESKMGSGTRVRVHKWEAIPKHTPNWKRYVEGGHFLPNLPFLRRIREALEHNASLIDFASGELGRDLSPIDELNMIMNKSQYTAHLGYDHPQGFVPLRKALVSFLNQYEQISTSDTSILITSGSQQSLYLITQCLLTPGDAVAMEEPSYAYSLPMFQSAGIRLFRIPTDEHGMKPSYIENLYKKHRIKMIFTNPNYQHPTGTLLSMERKKQLLQIVGELGIPIVEDDPFSLTAYDGHIPATLKSMDTNGSVIYIGSLSKIAASGLRVGWMVAPRSVVERLADARQQMDYGLSVVPQNIATQFLLSPYIQPHLEKLRVGLQFKRDILMEQLNKNLKHMVEYHVPKGGLHLWCKIIPEVNDGLLLEEGIKQGVLFVPGSVYGAPSGYVRFNYSSPSVDNIERGINYFTTALNKVLTE